MKLLCAMLLVKQVADKNIKRWFLAAVQEYSRPRNSFVLPINYCHRAVECKHFNVYEMPGVLYYRWLNALLAVVHYVLWFDGALPHFDITINFIWLRLVNELCQFDND